MGVLGIKGGTMPSNGEDLSSDNKMSKDSNDDDNGRSDEGVWNCHRPLGIPGKEEEQINVALFVV